MSYNPRNQNTLMIPISLVMRMHGVAFNHNRAKASRTTNKTGFARRRGEKQNEGTCGGEEIFIGESEVSERAKQIGMRSGRPWFI